MTERESTDEAQEEARSDMTPMIDAVFLLIIFFLCIDFRVLEAKLPAYLPKDRGSRHPREELIEQLPVRIVVSNDGTKVYRNACGDETWTDPRTGEEREAAYRLVGRSVQWEVGPRQLGSIDELRAELQRIYDDRTTWQPSAEHPGAMEPLPIVIEPQTRARYADVASTVDVVTAAGFGEISFGGGMGAR